MDDVAVLLSLLTAQRLEGRQKHIMKYHYSMRLHELHLNLSASGYQTYTPLFWLSGQKKTSLGGISYSYQYKKTLRKQKKKTSHTKKAFNSFPPKVLASAENIAEYIQNKII